MPGRGTRREHQIRRLLEQDGWVCLRAAGSLGPIDIVGLKRGVPPRFVQVKSDRDSAYKNFGPADRQMLAQVADQAGAEPWLVWWPPGSLAAWIHADKWPRR